MPPFRILSQSVDLSRRIIGARSIGLPAVGVGQGDRDDQATESSDPSRRAADVLSDTPVTCLPGRAAAHSTSL
jgi:hypothetical protein